MASLEKQLEKIAQQVEEKVKMELPLTELFPEDFMRKNSQYTNIIEFFDGGGFVFKTEEDFKNIDQDQLDSFINEKTDFGSWEDMYKAAATIQVSKKLKELGWN